MCGNFPIPDNRSDPPRLPGNRKVGVLKIIQSLMQLLLRRSPVWNLAPSVNSTPTTRMRSSASCSPIAIIFPRKFVKTVSVVSPLVYWKTKYNKESPLLKKNFYGLWKRMRQSVPAWPPPIRQRCWWCPPRWRLALMHRGPRVRRASRHSPRADGSAPPVGCTLERW